jgi:Transposase IS116/IS110/IS902 family
VHLAHPSGLYREDRRVKNDYRDCQEMLDRIRLNRLPEAWIAPPQLRQLRELVRYRAKAVALRSGLKSQIHAVLAKEGILGPAEMWGPSGTKFLNEVPLADAYAVKVESLRDLIDIYDREVAMLERKIADWLKDDLGYWAIQAIPGVGPTLAAIFVAEIGDISRFPWPPAAVLVGRVDTQTPRVRPDHPPGPDDQAGFPAGALGRGGGHIPHARRTQDQRRLPANRRPPRRQDRPHGGRPQAPHLGVFRPSRRPHPMPRPDRPNRVSRFGHSQPASSKIGMTPKLLARSTM